MAPTLLILSLPVSIAVFIMFFIGAQKVHKNRILWGSLGAFIFFLVIVLVFAASAFMLRNITVGDLGGHEIAFQNSIIAIVIAAGVFVSILVYKKILIKAPTVANNRFVFCSECGTQCPDNTAFCNKCGNKLSSV